MSARHDIISIGYNGTAPGKPGCLDGACPRGQHKIVDLPEGGDYDTPLQPGYCIATHAEMNALVRADHESLFGATMYITLRPCLGCMKIMGNTPLDRVVFTHEDKLITTVI